MKPLFPDNTYIEPIDVLLGTIEEHDIYVENGKCTWYSVVFGPDNQETSWYGTADQMRKGYNDSLALPQAVRDFILAHNNLNQ